MRKTMFFVTLLVGLALAIGGFLLSAPLGPASDPAISNPRMPFAPTAFVVGVIVMLASAVVYELFPGKEEKGK